MARYPDLLHIGDYKTAVNLFTETGYTPAHREMAESLNDEAFEQLVDAIAKSRGKTVDEVRALVDEGPFLAQQALESGSRRRAGVPGRAADEGGREGRRRQRAGGRRLRQEHDVGVLGPPAAHRGAEHQRDDRRGARAREGADGPSAGAETIAKSLRRIRRDSSIKAVVVRIDSPGGSSIASDLIWRELMLTKKEKPLVASMSDFAASGGYYVAVPASTIVAEPGTLTGSIGIFTGKFVVGGTLEKLGARIDGVSQGRFAEMESPVRPFSDEERQKLLGDMQAFYDNFIAKVADARKLSPERVHEIAQGRVWTGRQAKDLGLVDELGGLDRAIAIAKQAAKIEGAQDVEVVTYPPRKGFYESIARPFSAMGDLRREALTLLLDDEEARVVRAITSRVRLFRHGEPLALMPYVIQR